MNVARSVEDLIGSTPLVELTALLGADAPARVLGKLESANPGGSAKDRVALAMVEDAERRGGLSPRAPLSGGRARRRGRGDRSHAPQRTLFGKSAKKRAHGALFLDFAL